jgi:hypothetical protein
VRVQHTEQIPHGIGHGSSPLRAIVESSSGSGASGLVIQHAQTVVVLPYRSRRLRQNRVTVSWGYPVASWIVSASMHKQRAAEPARLPSPVLNRPTFHRISG